jgi:predicted RNase H-like HicB family nuclease
MNNTKKDVAKRLESACIINSCIGNIIRVILLYMESMQRIIKAEIYFDGEYYCARTLEFDVFTQGKTLDETVENLKEAVGLHIEDETDYDLHDKLSILAMMDLAV